LKPDCSIFPVHYSTQHLQSYSNQHQFDLVISHFELICLPKYLSASLPILLFVCSLCIFILVVDSKHRFLFSYCAVKCIILRFALIALASQFSIGFHLPGIFKIIFIFDLLRFLELHPTVLLK